MLQRELQCQQMQFPNFFLFIRAMTAIAFVREKQETTLDRVFVAGVTVSSVVVDHFVTHSGTMLSYFHNMLNGVLLMQ
jgi:hypothetical protein